MLPMQKRRSIRSMQALLMVGALLLLASLLGCGGAAPPVTPNPPDPPGPDPEVPAPVELPAEVLSALAMMASYGFRSAQQSTHADGADGLFLTGVVDTDW